jgi:hypothetical protein
MFYSLQKKIIYESCNVKTLYVKINILLYYIILYILYLFINILFFLFFMNLSFLSYPAVKLRTRGPRMWEHSVRAPRKALKGPRRPGKLMGNTDVAMHIKKSL